MCHVFLVHEMIAEGIVVGDEVVQQEIQNMAAARDNDDRRREAMMEKMSDNLLLVRRRIGSAVNFMGNFIHFRRGWRKIHCRISGRRALAKLRKS